MYLRWGLIAFFWRLGRWFGQTVSCCAFWRVTFIILEGQNYHHDDSLGPCASIRHISTLFPPAYDIKWLIDGKFRGVAAKIGGFVSIATFRGGRRQISQGADSKYQYWYWVTMNHNYSMGRVLFDGHLCIRWKSVLMEGPLYHYGMQWRRIEVKIWRFYRKSRWSSTSTKCQGLQLNK